MVGAFREPSCGRRTQPIHSIPYSVAQPLERGSNNYYSIIQGEYCGGKILYEEAFPNILFAVDGEIYNFDGYKCIVIGGAYSVDKHYRLAHGWHWWPDEQPDEEIKAVVEARLAALHWNIDIVLSHTCPIRSPMQARSAICQKDFFRILQ